VELVYASVDGNEGNFDGSGIAMGMYNTDNVIVCLTRVVV